jgi:hypothetical protein
VVGVVLGYLAAGDFLPQALLYLPGVASLEIAAPTSTELRSARELLALASAALAPPLAFLSIGLWLLRAMGSGARGAERLALAFITGSGAASLAILLLRGAGVPVPLPALAFVALAGAPLLAGATPAGPRGSPGARAVDLACMAVALLLFASALGPETGWDALEYHLPIAKAWSDGPIRALPGVFDAEFRTGADLLYVPAVAAGQPDAAAIISVCFALAIAALVRAEATRRAAPVAGACAGLFALLVPIVLEHAPTAYVDLAVGAYGFAALLSADRWNRTGDPRALLLSALCAAFAANAKLHGAILVPTVLAIVCLGGRPPSWRRLAGCGLLVTALVTPWLVKQALTTGNPFFPFLAERFGYGPTTPLHLASRREMLPLDFPAARTPIGFARYFAEIWFGRSSFIGGLVGPLPLALAPLAWHRPSRATVVLAATAAVLFVLQFAYAPALRFGTPLLPLTAVAAAVGGVRLARSGRLARAALASLCVVLAGFHLASGLAAYAPRIAAIRAPGPYERAVWPKEAALAEVVGRADAVVGIPMGAVLWMPKPVYQLLWVRNGEIFFDRRDTPERILEVLRRRGVRSIVIPARAPLSADGRIGNPIADAWLREGAAVRHPDPDPPAADPGRVWVRLDLAPH